MGFDFAEFPKQFVIARDAPPGLDDAGRGAVGGWRVHAAPEVPLVPVEAADGSVEGLLIGWAFDGKRPLGAEAPLRLSCAESSSETPARSASA